MATKIRLLHDTITIPTGAVAVTQSASDNTTKVATTAYVTTALANLADSAPSTLNTLNELAAALGDDANFSTTVTNSIATKLPLAGGTVTGNITMGGMMLKPSGDGGTIGFNRNPDSGAHVGDSGKRRFQINGPDDTGGDFLQIQSYNSSGTHQGNITIQDGKIGIGTTSPNSPLHVKTTNQSIQVRNTGNDNIGLEIYRDSDGAKGASFAWGNGNANLEIKNYRNDGQSSGPYANIDFFTGGTTADSPDYAPTRRMRIQQTGEVGIGTDNPTHTLDVTGTIRAYASGSGNAWLYTQNDNKTYITGVRGSSSNAYSIYDLTLDKSRFRVNSDGGIAIGENNNGYAGQILSIKAGTGDNVLYGESTDSKCIVSLRDNSSTANIGYGALANAHAFFQDGTEVARISTGSGDKYPTSGQNGGIGGSGTNLHLHGDDSEIRMANQIIHSDNSGNTKFTIRNAYGSYSTAAELSLDAGYITFNSGSAFTERMRIPADGNVAVGNTSNGGSLNIYGTGTQNATNDGKLYVEKNNNADWSIKCIAGADDYGVMTKGNGTYGLAVYSHNASAYKFRVNYDGAIYAVNTTVQSISDRRLKENIVDANSQWDDIKALKWRNYSWKESSGHNDGNTYLGLIADEVKAVSPNLVEIEAQSKEDIEAGVNNPNYENVKYSVVWLKAMKALQEAMIKIETLEAEVAALKG